MIFPFVAIEGQEKIKKDYKVDISITAIDS